MSDNRARKVENSQERPAGETTLAVSDQCELLASERRRNILRYMRENPSSPVSLATLVECLASIEQVSDAENVKISLVHTHLPKLAQAGVIEYTQSTRTIRYHRNRQVEAFLSFLDSREGSRL